MGALQGPVGLLRTRSRRGAARQQRWLEEDEADEKQHAPYVADPRDDDSSEVVTFVRDGPKIGRNERCPCGSGKKFKKCCIEK